MASGNITQIDGKPIIDATKPVTLEINANDIAKADRKEPLDCAVARACRRELHAKKVRVHLTRIYIMYNDGSWRRYMTPTSMRSDIIAFDRGGTFPPGIFVLKPPTGVRKATGKRKGTAPKHTQARNNPKRKKRVKYHLTEDVRSTPYG